ncbi:MAG: hypothetical protein KIT48_16265 [Pseudolabrys sp.]|nr:hypothetical protein [Pseudolabrys sp.]
MLSRSKIAVLVVTAAILVMGPAQAQYYSSVQQSPPPLYPYQQQPRAAQPYAIEVAPGTYVIQRPGEARAHGRRVHRPAPAVRSQAKAVRKNDPRLIDELKQRAAGTKTSTINTTKIVRLKPKVVETTRYVDDPPRVVERYTVVDDANGEKKVVVDLPPHDRRGAGKNAGGRGDIGKNEKRVIQADAEITVLGPDRMTIQLYRKGERGKPSARLN